MPLVDHSLLAGSCKRTGVPGGDRVVGIGICRVGRVICGSSCTAGSSGEQTTTMSVRVISMVTC